MQIIPADTTVTSLDRKTMPVATAQAGEQVRFDLSDRAYQEMTPEAIDANLVDFRKANRLTGPVFVDGAKSGDALGFTIEAIVPGSIAYVPFIAKWAGGAFPIEGSRLLRVPIEGSRVSLGSSLSLDVRPMVGCACTAPATGHLSTLSPAMNTGGNLDLQILQVGATIWLPVEVPGALFALGDMHASMGAAEPLLAGLECAGSVTGRFTVQPSTPLSGPRIETGTSIHFVGSHQSDQSVARDHATQAAWRWLTSECGASESEALVLCAGALDMSLGGPAGENIVASFDLHRLAAAGIEPGTLLSSRTLAGAES